MSSYSPNKQFNPNSEALKISNDHSIPVMIQPEFFVINVSSCFSEGFKHSS